VDPPSLAVHRASASRLHVVELELFALVTGPVVTPLTWDFTAQRFAFLVVLIKFAGTGAEQERCGMSPRGLVDLLGVKEWQGGRSRSLAQLQALQRPYEVDVGLAGLLYLSCCNCFGC
jgi:hypothetical protein